MGMQESLTTSFASIQRRQTGASDDFSVDTLSDGEREHCYTLVQRLRLRLHTF